MSYAMRKICIQNTKDFLKFNNKKNRKPNKKLAQNMGNHMIRNISTQ